MIQLKYMFSPIRIGNLSVRNRFIVSPMVMNYCTADGQATETYIAYHEERAKGGWGLIVTEDYAVDPGGKAFVGIGGLWEDGQIPGHAELTKRVHNHGAAIFAQIYHAGRQSARARDRHRRRRPDGDLLPLHSGDAARADGRGDRTDHRAVRRLRAACQEGRVRRGRGPRRPRIPDSAVHVLVLEQTFRQIRRQPNQPHAVPAGDHCQHP